MDDLDAHIVELENIPKGLMREVRQVVSKGALNIKKDWADRWKGHPRVKALPYSINYDVDQAGDVVSSEIGPDKDKTVGGGPFRTVGNLGNILEFGTPNNAPIPGGLPALAAEEPRFVSALGDLGEKAPVGDGLD